jgi:hypothetical protein
VEVNEVGKVGVEAEAEAEVEEAEGKMLHHGPKQPQRLALEWIRSLVM